MSTAANASLGTTVDARRTSYDPANGLPVRTDVLDSSNTVTASIVRGLDGLGRTATYTDATGTLYSIGIQSLLVKRDHRCGLDPDGYRLCFVDETRPFLDVAPTGRRGTFLPTPAARR